MPPVLEDKPFISRAKPAPFEIRASSYFHMDTHRNVGPTRKGDYCCAGATTVKDRHSRTRCSFCVIILSARPRKLLPLTDEFPFLFFFLFFGWGGGVISVCGHYIFLEFVPCLCRLYIPQNLLLMWRALHPLSLLISSHPGCRCVEEKA